MGVKTLLVPIDGTERSLKSIEFIKGLYDPETVKITLIHVKELVFIDGISITDEIKNSEKFAQEVLDKAKSLLDGFTVDTFFTFGYAGDEIIKKAKQDNFDVIVMTKSTKKGLTRIIGSCTSYVLKHSSKPVVVIPE